ncbi:MAG TPA: DeoR/GlpR family DNA-binding transcription regulator [Streptosporangiaceae bacterium]|nr:DeoR/GlpR family DNA-binding transcription regulator [Streptosporangiaceae bacterium]
MLASQRRQQIAEALEREGAVRVADLVTMLGVSDMTVRRDLDVMQRAGLLTKVHGGAMMPGNSAEEPSFEAKLSQYPNEKVAIARAAAALVRPGNSVAVSSGTTTWALARWLPPGITVLTNSVSLAEELRRIKHDSTVVLSGGVPTPSNALVGPVADAAIRSLNVDVLILGVYGMDSKSGFTTPNIAEAETDRTLVSCARRTVVVADHTKWRTVGLAQIGPLSMAHTLITDDGLDSQARESLSSVVGDLVLVTPGAGADLHGQPVWSPAHHAFGLDGTSG